MKRNTQIEDDETDLLLLRSGITVGHDFSAVQYPHHLASCVTDSFWKQQDDVDRCRPSQFSYEMGNVPDVYYNTHESSKHVLSAEPLTSVICTYVRTKCTRT